MLQIPLTSTSPWYEFTSVLEGETYRLTVRYNSVYAAWYLDILGLSNEVDLKGITLLGGIDLLEGLTVLELGKLFIYDQEGKETEPDRDSLGNRHILLYLTLSEVEDLKNGII